jgi:hypothetical protein
LSKTHIAEHMHSKVVNAMSMAAARAGAVKAELLDCSNELVRDRASTFILGLAGIKPDVAATAAPGQTAGVCIQIIQAAPNAAITIDHAEIIPAPAS